MKRNKIIRHSLILFGIILVVYPSILGITVHSELTQSELFIKYLLNYLIGVFVVVVPLLIEMRDNDTT